MVFPAAVAALRVIVRSIGVEEEKEEASGSGLRVSSAGAMERLLARLRRVPGARKMAGAGGVQGGEAFCCFLSHTIGVALLLLPVLLVVERVSLGVLPVRRLFWWRRR